MVESVVKSPYSLEGEVALITGGGTGLGLGMARCMVCQGAHVVIVGRREEQLKNACEGLGRTSSYFVHDVTDLDSADHLIARISEKGGPPTILVNNAGQHLKKNAVETTHQDFHALIDTHLLASHELVRACVPTMISAGHGSILFVSSMTAYMGMPRVIAYSAVKSAVTGMVRGLAAELSLKGIRVNAIAPGWIETAALRSALDNDPERTSKILSRTPMGRFGTPEEIGHVAAFLCSPGASFVNGAVLPVDGGAHMGF